MFYGKVWCVTRDYGSRLFDVRVYTILVSNHATQVYSTWQSLCG